jgi:hypothetical protein
MTDRTAEMAEARRDAILVRKPRKLKPKAAKRVEAEKPQMHISKTTDY